MENTYFLLKTNEDDRDCVKYIEIDTAENRFHICGACFCGITQDEQQDILNNFAELTTALTKDELTTLFEIDKKWYKDRTADDLSFLTQLKTKLESDLNKDIFSQVIEEEREYLKEEYSLTDNDLDTIFDYYGLDYKDRAVVCCVYEDYAELGENLFNCYEKLPDNLQKYFDYESFGADLVDDYNYIELQDGRIAELCY